MIQNRGKDFSELRKKAEKKLKSKDTDLLKTDSKKIEHELNVQKLELEMQNEELMAVQSKLVRTLEEYEELFNYAPIGYFILNEDGIIANVNHTGVNQLGIRKSGLIGKPLSTFINSQGCQDNFYRHRNTVLETQQPQQVECEMKKKNGNLFFARIDSSIVKDEKNRYKHFFTTISDISEQKEYKRKLELALSKERELNEMKAQFIAIASHEFRTPLTTILTSSELIEKYDNSTSNEKTYKHFRKIKTAIQRLEEILLDFLSAEDIEKGKIENNPETFDLVQFIETLLEEVKPFNGTHNVVYKHTDSHQNVYLDKKLLKTSLTNLFINAYKYSPDNGVIEITTGKNNSGNVTISVKDNGIGIPDNEQCHIFETFFRAKNISNIEGTGLGLHITKKLITIMGGTISFTSKENKGTTFTLQF